MILDIILLVLLFFGTVGGWRSGAFAMLLSLVVLVASLLIASTFAMKVGTVLHLGPTWAWPVIGFFLTFIILMILGGWIRGFFRPKHGLLRGIDGILGAVLGFVRAAFILGILLALLQLIHLPPEHFTERSHLYPWLIKLTSISISALRPYLHLSAPAHGVVV